MGARMNGGETDYKLSGEHADGVAPPGWYPDPYGDPVLRRWDGERWTLESRLLPNPEPGPALFNWPALVASLTAAGFLVSWFSWAGPDWWWLLAPVLLIVFGTLGAGPKYASGRGPGHVVALWLAVAGVGVIGLYLVGAWFMGAMLSSAP